MNHNVLNYFFGILYLVCSSHGVFKEWVPTTNLGDPANWPGKKLPCGLDRVYIDAGASVVYLQTDMTIRELILPNDVEVILGEGKALSLMDGQMPKPVGCTSPGQDLHFKPTGPRSWFDPSSWCFRDSRTSACSQQSLDTELVPCTGDDVVFPPNNAYYVDLDVVGQITVNSLTVSSKAYTTELFAQFLTTKQAKAVFRLSGTLSPVVKVNPVPCSDVTGCACGNDKPEILKKICSYKKQCESISCASPFKPPGNCCPICGAMLVLIYQTGFNMNDLKKQFKQIVIATYKGTNLADSALDFIVTKRSDSKVQITLRDRDKNSYGQLMGEKLAKVIRRDIKDGSTTYNVIKFTLTTSSNSASYSGQLASGDIAGLVLAIILILVLVLIFTLILLKRSGRIQNVALPEVNWSRFHLPRFQMPDFLANLRKPTPVIGVSVSFKDPDNITADICGFDNPMYGNTRSVGAADLSTEDNEYDVPDTSGFDNPLFESMHQEMKVIQSGSSDGQQTLHKNPAFVDDTGDSFM